MKTISKFAATLLIATNAVNVQATSYNVSAVFTDGGMQMYTTFDGSFDWDGNRVTNFVGLLSESMWGWNTNTNAFRMSGMNGGLVASSAYTNFVYDKPGGYEANQAPLLNLTHQLTGGMVDTNTGLVTVTTFLQNSTDVVWGGGYDVTTPMGGYAYGAQKDGHTRNYNGFFTLVFDANDPANTATTWDQIIYGDFTALGMMGPMLTGPVGMTGINGGGTMGGMPLSLIVSEISAVPLPFAGWLFGGALISLLSAVRRHRSCQA